MQNAQHINQQKLNHELNDITEGLQGTCMAE